MLETDSRMVELEALVDSIGLPDVLNALADIAYGKAEHLASNWQDEGGRKVWNRAGHYLATVAGNRALENTQH